MDCKYCKKVFRAKNAIFCSTKCYEYYKKDIDERVIDAMKKDTSHTKKISDSN